jgi:predicted DsbA family dithiol-disulfide isomerase
MLIEVWSDVVCPWCFIGKRRLESALEQAGVTDAEIVYRAFQLDPSATTDGARTVDVISRKYGVSPTEAEKMMDNVTSVAAGEGLNFRLLDGVSGNTGDAHRLILWAAEQGRGQELVEALFHRYFELAEPVFTIDDLLPIAEEVGLDRAAAAELLASDAYADQVVADQAQAAAYGANGAPFFVFDRKVAFSGAQPLEVFLGALEQVR